MKVNLITCKEDCCGCSACAAICPRQAITMSADDEGFWYPEIDEDLCVGCERCVKVCPIKNAKTEVHQEEEKRHIGIINLQFTNNYGAVIAAAALEEAVIRIVSPDIIVNTVNYMPFRNLDTRLATICDEARQWGGWKAYLKQRYGRSGNTEEKKIRGRRFSCFREAYLHLTPVFKNEREISKKTNYVAFITGSDVVWAPKRSDNFRAEGYYLKFADKGERRIAYAPSLDSAVNKQLRKMTDVYRENLRALDWISVREKDSVDYLQRLTNRHVYHCADPVFLVESDYFDKMIARSQVSEQDKYIYVYILEENMEIVDFARSLSEDKKLKICYYAANHDNFPQGSVNCTADGPEEFLYHLKNAEYVLTNSFHCVAFSILFHKQFLSFSRGKNSIKSSDLLSLLGLSERIVLRGKTADIDKRIDYIQVDSRVESFRNTSLDYLQKALSDL